MNARGLFRKTWHRGLLVTAALSVFSYAAEAVDADEVKIGPIAYTQDVNGVPVTITAFSFIDVSTGSNQIIIKARVLADLFDLQQKIGAIVDTFSLPKDNCRSYSANNPVVSIPRKELVFRNGAAIFSLGGTVTDWDCRENPIPNSKLDWVEKWGVKVPSLVTWPGSPIKNIVVTQPFDADLPVDLAKNNDYAVGIKFSDPNIQLKGQYAFITNGVLQLAGVDINQKAYDALQKAIDPEKLRLAIPEEISQYKPIVESAHFEDDAGHLTAAIAVSAAIPPATLTDLLKEMLPKK